MGFIGKARYKILHWENILKKEIKPIIGEI
jgi:hypothetical protein